MVPLQYQIISMWGVNTDEKLISTYSGLPFRNVHPTSGKAAYFGVGLAVQIEVCM